jgi:hypothetical protein
VYCPHCGKEIASDAVVCVGCGRALQPARGVTPAVGVSPKSRLVTTLLAFFLGELGIHRFYLGKIGTGVLMLLTLGGVGIWALIDFIMAVAGKMKDSKGLLVRDWQVD